MKIASIITKGVIKGDHLIIASKEECQEILSVFTIFCEQNKRKKKAKAMLRKLEDNLQVF